MNLDLSTFDLSQLPWAAILAWLAWELRQWRIWYQQNHGGAPDAPAQTPRIFSPNEPA